MLVVACSVTIDEDVFHRRVHVGAEFTTKLLDHYRNYRHVTVKCLKLGTPEILTVIILKWNILGFRMQ